MFKKVSTISIAAAILLSGCATPITYGQKQELKAYQAKGMAVEEKNPGTAAGLGLLPGGGSFYTRNYGTGVVNLLAWPLSIMWDPVSGYDGAESINYYATKQSVQAAHKKELRELDHALESKAISQEQYLKSKYDIEKKYAPEI